MHKPNRQRCRKPSLIDEIQRKVKEDRKAVAQRFADAAVVDNLSNVCVAMVALARDGKANHVNISLETLQAVLRHIAWLRYCKKGEK